jgi:hypothetical protein
MKSFDPMTDYDSHNMPQSQNLQGITISSVATQHVATSVVLFQSQLLPSSSSVSGESSCTYPITSSQCQVGKK